MQDWHKTVDWLREQINAPGLTLRLIVAGETFGLADLLRDAITIADAHVIEKAEKELVQSVKPLADDGLAKFYAHLPYPWELRPEASVKTPGWIKAKLKEIKDRAERSVLGDRYEGLYANGEEPEQSWWAAPYRLGEDLYERYEEDAEDEVMVQWA